LTREKKNKKKESSGNSHRIIVREIKLRDKGEKQKCRDSFCLERFVLAG
jgi:hypothetical protein